MSKFCEMRHNSRDFLNGTFYSINSDVEVNFGAVRCLNAHDDRIPLIACELIKAAE